MKGENQAFNLNLEIAGSSETTLCVALHGVTFHNGRLNFRLQEYLKSHVIEIKYNFRDTLVDDIPSSVQKFPAWHTKAAPNGKCCEGYIVPSVVRLMYQLKSVLE